MNDPVSEPRTPTVMVVEDDPVLRALASEVFEMDGFTVYAFATADAAWAWLEAPHPSFDLLFTDVRMPGSLDGLALARRVRQRLPRLPIIVSSGYTGQQYAEEDQQVLFLPKPWGINQLSQSCRTLLET